MAASRLRAYLVHPLGLGAIQAIAAATLVIVALSAPRRNQAFRGLVNDTNSSGSTRRLDLFRDALTWFPYVGEGLELEPRTYVWGLRASLAALAIVQVVALLAALHIAEKPFWHWMIGPAMTSLVLLTYPPFSADVFYYALSGHVANDGANPYVTPPRSFPDDPFLRFNDWRGITSPYGPLCTTISRGIVAITGPDPVRAAVAFKVVAALAALGLGFVCYQIARGIASDRRTAAGVFVLAAWQPALLIESAGTAHNDAIMMLMALGGLLFVQRGAVRGGLALIAASALIKYVTLPLLGFAVLTRLGVRAGGFRGLLRRWLFDVVVIALLTTFVFWSYWDGRGTVESLVREPARLYVNPLWVLPRLAVADRWGTATGNDFRDITRTIAQWAVGLLLVATSLWLIFRTWRARQTESGDSIRFQVRAWTVATTALALLPVNAHAWYAVWAVGPVALTWALSRGNAAIAGEGETTTATLKTTLARLPRWLWLYLVWSAISLLVYHTRIIR